MKKWSKGEVYI